MDLTEIDNRFDYHAPDDVARDNHQLVRESVKRTAMDLAAILPESREKSLALTNLEQAMFWSNAAIARHTNEGNRR